MYKTSIQNCILLDPQDIVRWKSFPTLIGHELTEEVLEEIRNKYEQKNWVTKTRLQNNRFIFL